MTQYGFSCVVVVLLYFLRKPMVCEYARNVPFPCRCLLEMVD